MGSAHASLFLALLATCPARSEGFLRAAAVLLDAGASANTGFYSTDHGRPEFESAIYGVAGVAHHPELTRLLLARGADPNDGETPYHAPETLDDRALHVLVNSRKMNADRSDDDATPETGLAALHGGGLAS